MTPKLGLFVNVTAVLLLAVASLSYPCRLLSAIYKITGSLRDQAELGLHSCQDKAARSLHVSGKLLQPYLCVFADNPAATSICLSFFFLFF